jgi:hypothetical protein
MVSKGYRFTIGYTYYDEPELLKEQMKLWDRYPHQIEIILIDDGSQKYPAFEILKDYNRPDFQLWKVDEDLGFNSHGCRNLIANLASSDNILFMDIDCHISPENVAFLKTCDLKKSSIYKFALYSSSSFLYTPWPGHPNLFIVNKDTFWEAGGYDESFTGQHYGDREFMDRLNMIAETRRIAHGLGINVIRGGRKQMVDPTVDRTVYDDENMIIKHPPKTKTYAEMTGTITSKINFSYSRML